MLESVILGIIQGITEFLPVSSSGHLELANYILRDGSPPEESMLMTVVLHFGTALSTIVIFRKEISRILRGLLQFKRNDEFDFSAKIVVSMIPAAIVGVLFKDQIEQLFAQKLLLIGLMLLVTGVLLFLADRATQTDKKITLFSALIIGISQAIAILPGISRSGATISTSVLLGIDREEAARFSFLMVIPLILGYMAKKLISDPIVFSSSQLGELSAGFLAAFITGMFACTWMIQLVKKSRLTFFSVYCAIVAAWAIFEAYRISGAPVSIDL